MNNILDKLEGILNPIFFNDFKKKIKSNSFWVNVIFLFIVYLIIFIILLNKSNFYIFDSVSVRTDYYVLSFTFLIVFAVFPLEIINITANEFKNNNMFFIFMSKINASQFLKGKFLFGVFYNAVLLISIIPILIYIYHIERIGLYKLIRIFYYCWLIPFPVILLSIYLACVLRKENALARYANKIASFFLLSVMGSFFVMVGVKSILDDDPWHALIISIGDLTISNPVAIDTIISFVIIILTAIFFHGLYSYLIKLYPMSGINNSIEPKSLSSFSYILKYIQSDNSINTDKLSNTSDEPKYSNNTEVSNPQISNETIIQIDSNQIKESSSQEESPLKTNKLEKLGVKINSKKRLSDETKTKIFFSFASIIFLFLLPLKGIVGYVYLVLSFFCFYILSIYLLTRDEKYDIESKSQIPSPGLKKVIFFPFAKGFVNGFVWLLISFVLYLLVLFFIFGKHIVPPGTRDIKHPFFGGYYVIIGSMLNIMSWCFLCRLFSDLFLNDPKDSEPKSEKRCYSIIAIIFISSLSQSKLDFVSNPLFFINYLIPSMLLYIGYSGFKGHLAFIYNLIFFIITIIPHLKTMKNQLNSYINHES